MGISAVGKNHIAYEGLSGAGAMTLLQKQRGQCLGEEDNGEGKKTELKVKEIMKMKHTGNVLQAKVIETLINETLADAEHLDIPGVVLKPSHRSPLVRYGIDRY